MDGIDSEPVAIACADGFTVLGQVWQPEGAGAGTVIVNAATGVLAGYYRFYAQYLAAHGYTVVTYDYRGIGASRPARLRGSGIRWRDWGELDFDAVLGWARAAFVGPVSVVGHSIGGFLPGSAANGVHIQRLLSVGAQHAYWPDYAARQRLAMVLRWHVAMPALTAVCGYFPGRALGWLEDLPAGVAHAWSFGGRQLSASPAVLGHFAAVRAPILAIGMSDDPFGTPAAIRRGLSYYTGSERHQLALTPQDVGTQTVGHFALFHSRFRETFWPATLGWLRDGTIPWPERSIY